MFSGGRRYTCRFFYLGSKESGKKLKNPKRWKKNGVPTVNTIKTYILRLAQLGMNRLYLYMEDTLEMEKYPYWGYLRGRYTKEEMKECDAFARKFGVILVPCIQTLAHLKNALKQPMMRKYKDIDDILLLENEESEALLKALLDTVQECFSGGIVHLGMDEAAHLGRGVYLKEYEQRSKKDEYYCMCR